MSQAVAGVLLLLLQCKLSTPNPDGQELVDLDTYTKEELNLLPEFRSRVRDGLTQAYMAQNKYLVRFLRARKLDVDEAENMIRENFRWRKGLDVDNMIFRNFSKFSQIFPFHFTSARDGRPTIVGALKDINVRQFVIMGDVEKLRHYMLYAIERAVWNVHLVANQTGREMIEGILLFNMAGFTMRNQACVACLPLWIELADSYERYYPQLGHKIIVINTPRIFQSLFAVMKPFTTGHTLNGLYLYSVDKSEWGPALLKIFHKERLTVQFGGSAPPQRLYNLTPEQIAIQLGPSFSPPTTKIKN